jgi:adenine-specific DNA methylase
MGRYYSGDIEGKFMFAVQKSTAADRFGSTHSEPSYVEYFFSEEHIETIEKELLLLKENYEKVVLFFESREGYTDEDLEKNGIVKAELSDYADYVLGERILNCIKETGCCQFTAEL